MIILVLIITQAIRRILNLPILPPDHQAISIIPPRRRVILAHIPVFATPMLPGMPLRPKANLLKA
jgi:hypothetical protein